MFSKLLLLSLLAIITFSITLNEEHLDNLSNPETFYATPLPYSVFTSIFSLTLDSKTFQSNYGWVSIFDISRFKLNNPPVIRAWISCKPACYSTPTRPAILWTKPNEFRALIPFPKEAKERAATWKLNYEIYSRG